MAKVEKPNQKFWKSEKKPNNLKLSESKDGLKGIVRFVKPKSKKKGKREI